MGSQERRTGEEYEAVPVCVLDLISFSGGELTLSSYPSKPQPRGAERPVSLCRDAIGRPPGPSVHAGTNRKRIKKTHLIREELDCRSSKWGSSLEAFKHRRAVVKPCKSQVNFPKC